MIISSLATCFDTAQLKVTYKTKITTTISITNPQKEYLISNCFTFSISPLFLTPYYLYTCVTYVAMNRYCLKQFMELHYVGFLSSLLIKSEY